MKRNFILFVSYCLMTATGWSQSVWQPVSSPVNENLVSLCFVDQQHGWILSEQGTLISTTDGGQSWNTLSLESGTYTSVHFTDLLKGWITGYQGNSFIMFTLDGGANWQFSDHPEASRLNDVYFHDSDHGWVVGIKDGVNYCLYTEDAGSTWVQQMNIFVQGAELYSVSFWDGQSGSACGEDGAFFIAYNAGSMWAVEINIPSYDQDLFSVYNWGTNKGCAVGSSGIALNTLAGWSTYIVSNTNTEQTLYAVSADPATSYIWAAGENGTIIYTPNYVLGWITQATGTTERLQDIDMIDASNGWAVGDNGTILRYGPNTGTDEFNIQSSKFRVEVYPNPAGKQISISFGEDITRDARLDISDLTGRMVYSEAINDLRPGQVQTINSLNLKEGIYLLRVTSGENSATSKIVIKH